jgi:tetratricopeptide (TPR) repeat protein
MDERTKGILIRCARSYFTVKAWDKAIREYENLVEEFPDDPFILEPLSICFKNMGKFDKAKDYLARAIHAYSAKGHPEKRRKAQAAPGRGV